MVDPHNEMVLSDYSGQQPPGVLHELTVMGDRGKEAGAAGGAHPRQALVGNGRSGCASMMRLISVAVRPWSSASIWARRCETFSMPSFLQISGSGRHAPPMGRCRAACHRVTLSLEMRPRLCSRSCLSGVGLGAHTNRARQG